MSLRVFSKTRDCFFLLVRFSLSPIKTADRCRQPLLGSDNPLEASTEDCAGGGSCKTNLQIYNTMDMGSVVIGEMPVFFLANHSPDYDLIFVFGKYLLKYFVEGS